MSLDVILMLVWIYPQKLNALIICNDCIVEYFIILGIQKETWVLKKATSVEDQDGDLMKKLVMRKKKRF